MDAATSSLTAAVSLDLLASSSKSNVRDAYNESAISSCLKSIGVDAEPLLTEDVRSLSLFMSALESFSSAYLECAHAKGQYESLLSRGSYSGTKIPPLADAVDSSLVELKKDLREISSKQLSSAECGIVLASVEKSQMLSPALASMQVLERRLQEVRRRLQMRSAQMFSSCDASRVSTAIHLKCHNGLRCSWELTMSSLADGLIDGQRLPGPLTHADVITCGRLLRYTNALLVTQLLEDINQLHRLLPLLYTFSCSGFQCY